MKIRLIGTLCINALIFISNTMATIEPTIDKNLNHMRSLRVLAAIYGGVKQPKNILRIPVDKWIDVTNQIRHMVKNEGKITIPGAIHTFVGNDPLPNVKKEIEIHLLELDGTISILKSSDGTPLNYDFPTADRNAEMAAVSLTKMNQLAQQFESEYKKAKTSRFFKDKLIYVQMVHTWASRIQARKDVFIAEIKTKTIKKNIEELGGKLQEMLTQAEPEETTTPSTEKSNQEKESITQNKKADSIVQTMKKITVGSYENDLTLFALDEKGTLYSYIMDTWMIQEAKFIDGTKLVFIDVALSSDGTLGAINNAGKAFIYDTQQAIWEDIPMPKNVVFDQISIGNHTCILATNQKTSTIYQYNTQEKTWTTIAEGTGSFVSAGIDGTIVALNKSGTPFLRKDEKWHRMGNYNLKMITVGNADLIMGINDQNEVVEFKNNAFEPVKSDNNIPTTDVLFIAMNALGAAFIIDNSNKIHQLKKETHVPVIEKKDTSKISSTEKKSQSTKIKKQSTKSTKKSPKKKIKTAKKSQGRKPKSNPKPQK
ncbi:MAG: hypothetical protein US69_C0005G0016 [candidate division TM6 bacterium GW2011_GWF2_38_10]|nr:MAG: hypothetical protein US69_C0005G0016 [candidate division TM6 bacterium GW2011_GWF2_38_10]